MESLNQILSDTASIIWWPVLFLIIGGGLYFLIYSRFLQYKYFIHALNVLRGKYDDPNAPGQITAYRALSTALASTVGMGNLAGVAAAIAMGGPGALFWMWVTSFIGMSTNFFTSALASMYRGKDSTGELQGGPMYVIREVMGKRWQPLATLFCVCCMVGCLPIFQANQLTQALLDIGLKPMGLEESFITIGSSSISVTKFIIGLVIAVICSLVIIGGIKRIGAWAGRLVPLMIVLHFVSVVIILVTYADRIPYYLGLIFRDAFAADNYHGEPFLGGVVGGIIMLGVRRATFSNEAGIGTAPMAMGASKSVEPIREGLISMLSPVIDTIISCSLTALSILVTDAWLTKDASGITLTSLAYRAALPQGGDYVLLLCTFVFAISALFSYSYYGRKALSFLVGERKSAWYDYFYLSTIALGAIASMDLVLNLIDIAFAIMAIPTMISGLVLAPRVMKEAKEYFKKLS
ncbi:alanine/glycine:cation symporter family protein [Chryseosolibacter indicus]|uniref:Amino acid carrier protein n=1 Tax=Chryseosolibacter indicus TaxID=2782351 RepID=A0ABS5VR17_9BACT|nr:alanine/glycine:cation symporter family protein [Chryseosolibacter indicus]MBT1703289.1 amino acid carrier protein [Chryseosolibacter indicus]